MGVVKEPLGRTAALNYQEQEQRRARERLSPKQGLPDSKTKCSHRAKPNLTRRGISSQQPPKIKMATSLENVKRSLGGSRAKMLLLKGCFLACYSSPDWPCLGVGQIHGRKGDVPLRSFRGAESTPPHEKE